MKERPTTDSWTDCLGQKYEPGDCVAYASISGRSPQMVIAEVLNIFTHDSNGKRYTESGYDPAQGKYVSRESVAVQVMPLLDARDFYRSDKPRAVNLTIVANILRVPDELKPKPKMERDLERNTAGILDILKDLSG